MAQLSGMVLTRVKPWESIKKYEDELSSQHSTDLQSDTSLHSVGAEKASRSKGKGSGKGKGKVEPQLQIAIGDDFDALRRKIDFTGFVDPSHDSDSSLQAEPAVDTLRFPGIAESAELTETSATASSQSLVVSHEHESAMHSVGDTSENFVRHPAL